MTLEETTTPSSSWFERAVSLTRRRRRSKPSVLPLASVDSPQPSIPSSPLPTSSSPWPQLLQTLASRLVPQSLPSTAVARDRVHRQQLAALGGLRRFALRIVKQDPMACSYIQRVCAAPILTLLLSLLDKDTHPVPPPQARIAACHTLEAWFPLCCRSISLDLRTSIETSLEYWIEQMFHISFVQKGDLVPPKSNDATKRHHIIREIIATEGTYVATLRWLVEDIAPLLAQDNPNVLGNLPLLCNLHQHFLNELHQRLNLENQGIQSISHLFLVYIDYFRMYSDYINQYDKMSTTLQQTIGAMATKTRQLVAAQIEQFGQISPEYLETSSNVMSRLTSYLIAPIQRVPRYLLLLEELYRNSDQLQPHQDLQVLEQAVRKLRIVTEQLNEKKRQVEKRQQVCTLVQSLTNVKPVYLQLLQQPHCIVIRQDALEQYHSNAIVQRYVYMVTGLLICLASKSSTKVRSVIELNPSTSIHIDTSLNQITIDQDTTYQFKSRDQLEQYSNDLHQVCLGNDSSHFLSSSSIETQPSLLPFTCACFHALICFHGLYDGVSSIAAQALACAHPSLVSCASTYWDERLHAYQCSLDQHQGEDQESRLCSHPAWFQAVENGYYQMITISCPKLRQQIITELSHRARFQKDYKALVAVVDQEEEWIPDLLSQCALDDPQAHWLVEIAKKAPYRFQSQRLLEFLLDRFGNVSNCSLILKMCFSYFSFDQIDLLSQHLLNSSPCSPHYFDLYYSCLETNPSSSLLSHFLQFHQVNPTQYPMYIECLTLLPSSSSLPQPIINEWCAIFQYFITSNESTYLSSLTQLGTAMLTQSSFHPPSSFVQFLHQLHPSQWYSDLVSQLAVRWLTHETKPFLSNCVMWTIDQCTPLKELGIRFDACAPYLSSQEILEPVRLGAIVHHLEQDQVWGSTNSILRKTALHIEVWKCRRWIGTGAGVCRMTEWWAQSLDGVVDALNVWYRHEHVQQCGWQVLLKLGQGAIGSWCTSDTSAGKQIRSHLKEYFHKIPRPEQDAYQQLVQIVEEFTEKEA